MEYPTGMRIYFSFIFLALASCKPHNNRPVSEPVPELAQKPRFIFPTANTQLLKIGNETNFFARTNPERPWQSGAYGCVRNSRTRIHEGIDILALTRDENNEPLDEVFASREGIAEHVNRNVSASNYGKYVVLSHKVDDLPAYTLYAHLQRIEVGIHIGDKLQAGSLIGVLGRTANTREEIEKWRAHLHFEIGVQINSKFNQWFPSWYKDGRNLHGNWSGINLLGLDAAQILKLNSKGKFSLKQYLRSMPALCTVTVFQGEMDWIDRYPELIDDTNIDGDAPVAWDLALNFNGIPIRIIPRRGKIESFGVKYRIRHVDEDVRENHPCSGLVFRKGQKWVFTSKGQRLMNLLIFR